MEPGPRNAELAGQVGVLVLLIGPKEKGQRVSWLRVSVNPKPYTLVAFRRVFWDVLGALRRPGCWWKNSIEHAIIGKLSRWYFAHSLFC